jgi:hypothetical protein
VLLLAGTNALATVAFALIYAGAGSRWLTQGAFLASLAVFFFLLTALWVHVERSRPARDALSRKRSSPMSFDRSWCSCSLRWSWSWR